MRVTWYNEATRTGVSPPAGSNHNTPFLRKGRVMATDQSTTVSAPVEYRDLAPLGFPGYRVGSDGSVWSCCKQVRLKGKGAKGKMLTVLTDQWRPLKQSRDDAGRPRVSPSRDGRQKPLRVCRLVLESFAGPCPEGMEACHGDGNPANNALSNLRWDTPRANAADRRSHGREARGGRIGTSKLSQSAVQDIRANCVPGSRDRGFSAFARRYRVGQSTIRRAWSGVAWGWLQNEVVDESVACD
jgi:hypothetical protein